MKITKNRKQMLNNFDTSKIYEPLEAIKILKEKSFVKFKETIDISINLGIDSNKTDQNIKGVVNLPNGTGKTVKVAVIANEDKQKDAKNNGADLVGVKFKNDKSGIVHAGVGKLDFSEEDLLENIKTFYSSVSKSKPDAVKGSFIKKVTIASTMGFGLNINQASLR